MPNIVPAIITSEGWRPSIGDPTPWGWTIVFGYYLAAVLCASHVFCGPARQSPGRYAWAVVALAVLLLGVNKQFDLAGWVWWTGRNAVRSHGWAGAKRALQLAIMGSCGVLAGAVATKSVRSPRRPMPRGLVISFVGLSVCGVLVALRTLSFHELDTLLALHVGEFNVNRGTELAGIATIMAGALLGYRGDRETGP